MSEAVLLRTSPSQMPKPSLSSIQPIGSGNPLRSIGERPQVKSCRTQVLFFLAPRSNCRWTFLKRTMAATTGTITSGTSSTKTASPCLPGFRLTPGATCQAQRTLPSSQSPLLASTLG